VYINVSTIRTSRNSRSLFVALEDVINKTLELCCIFFVLVGLDVGACLLNGNPDAHVPLDGNGDPPCSGRHAETEIQLTMINITSCSCSLSSHILDLWDHQATYNISSVFQRGEHCNLGWVYGNSGARASAQKGCR